MNKTEADYAQTLRLMLLAGTVLDYRFEAVTLKLAHDLRYTPDFLVVTPDEIQLHEVKGHWEDDARAKIRMAQERHPWFRFVAIRKRKKAQGGGWTEEEFQCLEGTPRQAPSDGL